MRCIGQPVANLHQFLPTFLGTRGLFRMENGVGRKSKGNFIQLESPTQTSQALRHSSGSEP